MAENALRLVDPVELQVQPGQPFSGVQMVGIDGQRILPIALSPVEVAVKVVDLADEKGVRAELGV